MVCPAVSVARIISIRRSVIDDAMGFTMSSSRTPGDYSQGGYAPRPMATDDAGDGLAQLTAEIVECRRCPRLVEWRERVAREKRRAFRDQEYWGRPVPGWGDPDARILVLGLAPAAHGANRTGRMFTGDESGRWLYRALWRAGFANQPESVARGDGLELHDAFVTAIVRCAPPTNAPTPQERANCRRWLEPEIELLPRVR